MNLLQLSNENSGFIIGQVEAFSIFTLFNILIKKLPIQGVLIVSLVLKRSNATLGVILTTTIPIGRGLFFPTSSAQNALFLQITNNLPMV